MTYASFVKTVKPGNLLLCMVHDDVKYYIFVVAIMHSKICSNLQYIIIGEDHPLEFVKNIPLSSMTYWLQYTEVIA